MPRSYSVRLRRPRPLFLLRLPHLVLLLLLFRHTPCAHAQDLDPDPADVAAPTTTVTVTHLPANCRVETKAGDYLHIRFVGRIHNESGPIFATSEQTADGVPVTFRMGEETPQVILGWEKGLERMCAGERRSLVVPPNEAYGPSTHGQLPSDATLWYDVQLVSINGLVGNGLAGGRKKAEKEAAAAAAANAARLASAAGDTNTLGPLGSPSQVPPRRRAGSAAGAAGAAGGGGGAGAAGTANTRASGNGNGNGNGMARGGDGKSSSRVSPPGPPVGLQRFKMLPSASQMWWYKKLTREAAEDEDQQQQQQHRGRAGGGDGGGGGALLRFQKQAVGAETQSKATARVKMDLSWAMLPDAIAAVQGPGESTVHPAEGGRHDDENGWFVK
jgi:FK506-binding protein 2